MSIRDKFEWLVKGEVSEHIFLQSIVVGGIAGFCAALYPAPVASLIKRIGIFDGFTEYAFVTYFVFFCSYVLPVLIGLYGFRMLLNGLVQSIPTDD